MTKHTFKVGDRVIIGNATQGYYSVSRCGESGVLKEVCKNGYEVALDKQELNRGDGIWYVYSGDLRHDSTFQVGDWVRYEGVEDGYVPEMGGEVGIVTCTRGFSTVGVKFPAHWDHDVLWNKANLVKIQPPQEAQVKTVKIKHEKYGVVEGVTKGYDCWHKNGAMYCKSQGWSQVPEVEWVTIQVEKEGFSKLTKYGNVYGYSDEACCVNEKARWRYQQ